MERDIYNQKIKFFNNELEKIRNILSSFTNGTGILLTIAGLLSFLPPLINTNHGEYLLNFLLWTFPFLLISIASYYPSSLRVSSIVKGHPFSPTGSEEDLEILKNQVQYLELVWRKSVENHDSVLFWNNITKSFIFAYIFSLISNFYCFVLYGKSNLWTSLILLTTSLLVATLLFLYPRMKSEKNKIIGGDKPKK